MKDLDKLQNLIDQLNAKDPKIKYTLEYHSQNGPTFVGYVFQGYYLITRVEDMPAPRPAAPNYQEYVHGKHIGDTPRLAEAYLLNLLKSK